MKTKSGHALLQAITVQSLRRVQSLLEDELNPNSDFLTDLGHLLRLTNNIQIGQLLISYGVKINLLNFRFDSFLFYALLNKFHTYEFTELLLENGADVNFQDSNGNTPLHFAVMNSRHNLVVIKLLLNYGADVNLCNENHDIPLHIVLRNTNVMSNSSVVYSKCNATHSVLKEESYIDQRLNVVKLLMDHGADVNLSNNSDGCPLHIALANVNCDSAIVLELLKHDAKVTSKDNFQLNSPLHIAVQNCKIEPSIIKALLKHGADVNSRNFSFNTPLHLAARTLFIKTDTIEILLGHGADGKAKNDKGNTPLHLAAHSNPFLIPNLIRHISVNINDKNNVGDTPLIVMLKKSTLFPCIVKDMIQIGADVNISNSIKMTPLHYAIFNLNSCRVAEVCRKQSGYHSVFNCSKGMLKQMKLKTEKGAYNYVPLNQLCEIKLLVIKELLKNGANIHAQDYLKRTPLGICVEYLINKMHDSCCSKLFLKYWVLKHANCTDVKGLGLEIYKSHPEYNLLRDYFYSCFKEVSLLKTSVIYETSTLYDLVSGKKLLLKKESVQKTDLSNISERVFKSLIKSKFHVFWDDLGEFIGREYLVDKFLQYHFQATSFFNGGSIVNLSVDAMFILTEYLSHVEILKCILTFINYDAKFSYLKNTVEYCENQKHKNEISSNFNNLNQHAKVNQEYKSICPFCASLDGTYNPPAIVKLSAGIICGTARDRFGHVVDKIVQKVKIYLTKP